MLASPCWPGARGWGQSARVIIRKLRDEQPAMQAGNTVSAKAWLDPALGVGPSSGPFPTPP